MEPDIEEIETRLKSVLLERLELSLSPDEIKSDTALVGTGLALDSVTLLEFVVGVEDEFGIILDDSALTVSHFEALSALAQHVRTELAGQAAS